MSSCLRRSHFLVSSSGQSDFQSYADALWWGVVSFDINHKDAIFNSEDDFIFKTKDWWVPSKWFNWISFSGLLYILDLFLGGLLVEIAFSSFPFTRQNVSQIIFRSRWQQSDMGTRFLAHGWARLLLHASQVFYFASYCFIEGYFHILFDHFHKSIVCKLFLLGIPEGGLRIVKRIYLLNSTNFSMFSR